MSDITYKDVNFMIVDDYQAVRAMVKKDLREIGVKGMLYEASSAEEAIASLRDQYDLYRINFIVSDWEMEKGNGIDLLKYVRSQKKFEKIPFLMLTSLGKKELVLKAVTEGVTDYLLKPWDQAQILAKIENCWKKSNPFK